jgi:hypothetical protein
MLKNMLLATAILLPLALPAQAGMACGVQPGPGGGSYDCVWDGRVEDDDDILTPAEQRQIAAIKDGALKRADRIEAGKRAEFTKQRALEDARHNQCLVPLLWIKCPPRTPEAEHYWTAFYRSK